MPEGDTTITENPTTEVNQKTETVSRYTVGAVSPDSRFMNVSVLAWVLLIVILTVCGMAVCRIEVTEPLYTLALIITSFYTGKQVGKSTP